MLDCVFFELKIHYTKLARPLSVKQLGPISGFCPITKEDSCPLIQQIDLASKCKTASNITLLHNYAQPLTSDANVVFYIDFYIHKYVPLLAYK